MLLFQPKQHPKDHENSNYENFMTLVTHAKSRIILLFAWVTIAMIIF